MTIIDDALSTFPQFATYNQMLIQGFCENLFQRYGGSKSPY